MDWIFANRSVFMEMRASAETTGSFLPAQEIISDLSNA
jgi:hypothetical protein